jgi:hypothetical protein
MNKTYKTYQARNAVFAALVTNHIKARKKLGVSHARAKAEAYRIHGIKAALPILRRQFDDELVEVVIPVGLATAPPKELLNG